LRCKGYMELIYRWLWNDMYIELICMRISYEEIICVYRKGSNDNCVSGLYTRDH
jgi:hypothetical protein